MLRNLLLGHRARRHWLALFVALSAATLVVALLPAERAPDATGWDKLDHALAFGALGVVGVFALRWMRRGVVLLVPLLAALGAAIELLQAFVPSRRADAADFVADVVGAVLGTLLAWWVARALEGPVRDEPAPPPR